MLDKLKAKLAGHIKKEGEAGPGWRNKSMYVDLLFPSDRW